MSLLRSKALRVFTSISATLTDATEEARTWAGNSVLAPLASGDYLYIGKDHAFNHLYLAMDNVNDQDAVMTAEYWTGAGWKAITSFLDETNALKASGFISWPEGIENYQSLCYPTDKVPGLEDSGISTELFWVRLSVSAPLASGTSIRAVKQLLSDDRLMTVLHPEIMNYLPAGQTDFLPQHEAAKDAIVTHLRVKGLISYEEQLKDPEDWMLAATYKCIELILAPITGDERLDKLKKEMAQSASNALVMSAGSIDKDKSEHLEKREVTPQSFTWGER